MRQSDIHQGGHRGLFSQWLDFSLAGMVTGVLLALVFSLFSGGWAFAKESAVNDVNSAGLDEGVNARLQENYGKLPLYFIRNDGQVDSKVKFYEKGSGHTTYFTKEGVYLLLGSSKQVTGSSEAVIASDEVPKQSHNFEVVKLSFLDANKDPEIVAADPQEGKVNYFTGSDPKKWRTNVPTYLSVLYKEVYPGIDIKFYGNNLQIEYDIIVKPGADPSKVKFAYEGIEGLKVAENGDLEISLHTPSTLSEEGRGEGNLIIQKRPFIYQEIDGKRVEVSGRFKVIEFTTPSNIEGQGSVRVTTENRQFAYGFELAGYDRKVTLIIDPALYYATYLGGSGTDVGRTIAVDSSGNAYVTGVTYSADFPATPGVFDTSYNGGPGEDVFVTKLSPTGSSIIYSTFLGGSTMDAGSAIAIDSSGNAYVTGTTRSTDFPVTGGVFGPTYNGDGGFYYGDVFVAKLNATGSSLLYSTFLGGSDGEEVFRAIAVDSSGNAYVSGETYSTDFPTTPGAFDTSHNGGRDVFVAKLNTTASSLIYSTYIGGSYDERGASIAVDSSGNAYVTGDTESADFPTTPGAFDTSYNIAEVFVTKLNATGSSLIYSTLLGGSNQDNGYAIAVDSSGNAYVSGVTYVATDFPTTAGAFDTSHNGGRDVFVTKLNPTGTALVYSTFLGGSGDEEGLMTVDSSGNAYVTGFTDSYWFPITAGGFDKIHNGGPDVFVTKFNSTGTVLDYSTFLGGSGNELAAGIAIDSLGNVYIAGLTSSITGDFPVTDMAYDSAYNGGGYDAFVAKIVFDFQVNQYSLTNQRYPAADYNPDTGEYLVLWQDGRNGFNDDIYGVRLDLNGNRIGSDFAVAIAAGHQQRVSIKAGGGGYLAVWHDLRNQATTGADIYGVWIAGDGTVGAEMTICACAANQWNPVVEYDLVSNTFMVVFLNGVGDGSGNDVYDLWGAVIPAGGAASVSTFPMVTATGGQRGPRFGYDYGNSRYYLAWNDRRGSDYNIYGSRVTATGTILDGGGTGVLLANATGNQFRPTVTDRRPADGINNHFVVWTDYRAGAQGDVYGIYVDGNGVTVGSEIPVSTVPELDQANIIADVDWIRTKKNLVSWVHGIVSPASAFDLSSAYVDQSGVVEGKYDLAAEGASLIEQRAEFVVYTTDGINDYGFLVVWMDNRTEDYNIHGMRVWP